jgi:hypothetical protein
MENPDMATPTPHTQTGERYIMALYYGYGRQDACRTHSTVDPIVFAEHYLSLFADFTNGESSYMPSVQDAWDRFRRSQAS